MEESTKGKIASKSSKEELEIKVREQRSALSEINKIFNLLRKLRRKRKMRS